MNKTPEEAAPGPARVAAQAQQRVPGAVVAVPALALAKRGE
jgi:hypothetical protein